LTNQDKQNATTKWSFSMLAFITALSHIRISWIVFFFFRNWQFKLLTVALKMGIFSMPLLFFPMGNELSMGLFLGFCS